LTRPIRRIVADQAAILANAGCLTPRVVRMNPDVRRDLPLFREPDHPSLSGRNSLIGRVSLAGRFRGPFTGMLRAKVHADNTIAENALSP